MLSLWLLVGAFAGAPAELPASDVRVIGSVALAPAEIISLLTDLPRARGLFDETCATRWTVGVPESGLGARARLTWRPSILRRRVTLEVAEVKGEERVVWSASGRYGFDVVWRLSAQSGGTRIEVETPLEPPGWPFRRMYYRDILPAWGACYQRAIRGIAPPPSDALDAQ